MSPRGRTSVSRIIGIDLGTTNSLVAYVDEATGLPRVIPDAEGRPLLPSVVAFTPDGIVVGEAARRQLARRPADTVYSVKRLMGRGHEDVKDEMRFLPFRIVHLVLDVLVAATHQPLGRQGRDALPAVPDRAGR